MTITREQFEEFLAAGYDLDAVDTGLFDAGDLGLVVFDIVSDYGIGDKKVFSWHEGLFDFNETMALLRHTALTAPSDSVLWKLPAY